VEGSVKREAEVLDPVAQESTDVSPDERTGHIPSQASTDAAHGVAGERSFGKRVKDFVVGVGQAIERAMDRNHEFDHW
jgi:hypothetical protein